MSATNSLETAVLTHLLHGDAIASLSGVTTFYLSLHTASPGEAGNQSTSETAYTGYERQELGRDSGDITISGNEATNANAVNFPQCTGNLQTLTHFGIGTASTGTGALLFWGALDESINLTNLMTPVIEAGNLSITCD